MRSHDTDAYRDWLAKSLAPDREELLRGWSASARERDQPLLVEQLKTVRKDLRKSENPDVVSVVYNELADELSEAYEKLGFPAEKLRRFWISSSTALPAGAEASSYPDGSALIQISDHFFGLLGSFGEYVAYTFGGARHRNPFKWYRAAVRGMRDDPEETMMFAVVLRYFFLHQRTWDTVTKIPIRLDPSAAEMQLWMQIRAVKFVIAHEMAHYLLDHPPLTSAAAGKAAPHLYTDDTAIELAADDLALRVTLAGLPQTKQQAPYFAAVATFSAISAWERALFIRRARSHPSEAERLANINRQVPPRFAASAQLMAGRARRAGDVASDFDHVVPPEAWQRAMRHPNTVTEAQDETYRTMIATLDLYHSHPVDDFGRFVREQFFDSRALLDHVAAGDIRAALGELPMSATQIEELVDPDRPLTFYRARSAISAALSLREEASPTVRTVLGIVITRKILPHLKGQ